MNQIIAQPGYRFRLAEPSRGSVSGRTPATGRHVAPSKFLVRELLRAVEPVGAILGFAVRMVLDVALG